MTEAKKTDDEKIALIEDALHELLLARREWEISGLSRSRQKPVTFTPFKFLDLDEMAFESLTADPIRWGLRTCMKRLGEVLFSITGSTEKMQPVLERVASRDPESYGRRASIIDKAWDGIGNDRDRWYA